MKYLIVDGYFAGTGIRDKCEGGYVKVEDLGLSDELTNELKEWHLKYSDARFEEYQDKSLVDNLDAQGKQIALNIKKELGESKIEYYSDARMMKEII
jgi:hypothetical protein